MMKCELTRNFFYQCKKNQWVQVWFISICRCSHLRENTISSLKNAYSHGADMVEFDVHLSKDKIPVIYHDFELCTTSLSKDGQQGELIPMQLKNLTLKQLRGLKIHHVNAIDNGVKVNVFYVASAYYFNSLLCIKNCVNQIGKFHHCLLNKIRWTWLNDQNLAI